MPNKTVLITGTSRGIGLHLAKRFLMEGFGVIGVSRDKSSISHRNFQEIHADLSKTKEIEMIANQLSGESITGLINNAGAHGPIGPFERLSIDDWIDTFNLIYLEQRSFPKFVFHLFGRELDSLFSCLEVVVRSLEQIIQLMV